jgi:hypothetical protein
MAQKGYALSRRRRRRTCAGHMPRLLNGRLRLADNHALDFQGWLGRVRLNKMSSRLWWW